MKVLVRLYRVNGDLNFTELADQSDETHMQPTVLFLETHIHDKAGKETTHSLQRLLTR